MRTTAIAAAALAGAAFAVPVVAGTLIPVAPVSGATSTLLVDINDKNVVTGGYKTADQNFHGFLGTIDGNYTFFDYPGGNTEGRAINNDGYILAIGEPSGNNFYGDAFARETNGDLVPITKGHKIIDGLDQGLLAKGSNFVAERWGLDKDENAFAYGYYGKGTKYKSDLNLPFATDRTRPRGVNKDGTVVGYFLDPAMHNYGGFVLNGDVAVTAHFPDARAYSTVFGGINEKGTISGYWTDQNGTVGQAFTYDPDSNTFNVIRVPGANIAQGFGINSKGYIAITSDVGNFIYCTNKPAKCPGGAAAIEIKEQRIAAAPGSTRIAACEHHCLMPTRPERKLSPAEAAKLRQIIKNDPMRSIELGLTRR